MNQLASNAAGLALSLLAASTVYKSSTVAQTAIAAPLAPETLAATGLTGYTGLVLIPTSGILNPWRDLSVVCLGVKCLYVGSQKWKEKKKDDKFIKFLTSMNDIVLRAWLRAHDTEVFLGYVRFSAVDDDMISIDVETFDKWTNFISGVGLMLDVEVTEQDLGLPLLLIFMDVRREELEAMRSRMTRMS